MHVFICKLGHFSPLGISAALPAQYILLIQYNNTNLLMHEKAIINAFEKLIFLINNYIFQISYIVFVIENSDTFPSPIANQIIYIHAPIAI